VLLEKYLIRVPNPGAMTFLVVGLLGRLSGEDLLRGLVSRRHLAWRFAAVYFSEPGGSCCDFNAGQPSRAMLGPGDLHAGHGHHEGHIARCARRNQPCVREAEDAARSSMRCARRWINPTLEWLLLRCRSAGAIHKPRLIVACGNLPDDTSRISKPGLRWPAWHHGPATPKGVSLSTAMNGCLPSPSERPW